MKLYVVLLVFCHLVAVSRGLIERLYCGNYNCYELLDLDRDASPAEIRKAYRKKAVRYHPDKNKEKGSREKFEQITTAYEVLKDEEERENYDYMLDHPEEFYSHYYRYYRRRTPKVDVRLVVISSIVVISLVQFVSWWYSYQAALDAALKMPKYRTCAKEMAVSRGLIAGEGTRRRRLDKEGKVEEEAILRSIVEENLNITGGYRKPRLLDVLLFKVLFLPYTLILYLLWYGKWVWQFNIKGEPYGIEERAYLTRKTLGISLSRWEALGGDERERLIKMELWVGENYQQWKKEKEEEMKEKFAESSKHKMYRRYMKSKGKPTNYRT